MRQRIFFLATWFVLLSSSNATAFDESFELADGARVALVGNTLIERAQTFGYLETALTARWPERNITFRNLGWSGDTVFGAARAGFGSAKDGFRHLSDHVTALKPTVLIVGYGANASFDGAEKLPGFVRGLDKLLDTFDETRANIVLLSPTRHEYLGPPLPNPTVHNEQLALYRDAIRETAEARGQRFIDLFSQRGPSGPSRRLTSNGLHLGAYGYWRLAATIEAGLGLPALRWRVAIVSDSDGARCEEAEQTSLSDLKPSETGVTFAALDDRLPPPPPPAQAPGDARPGGHQRLLAVRGLRAGKYTLSVDRQDIATGSAEAWARGVSLGQGPEFDQVERLREAIIAKNRLYFFRWRPQNETYLFGFRKHEQGQNAREIPLFDPLVVEQESIIATLRKPITRYYELRRVDANRPASPK